MQFDEYKRFIEMSDDEFSTKMIPKDIPEKYPSFNHIFDRHINITKGNALNRLLVNKEIKGSSAFISDENNNAINNIRTALSQSGYQNKFDKWIEQLAEIQNDTNIKPRLKLSIDFYQKLRYTIHHKYTSQQSSLICDNTNSMTCIFEYDPINDAIYMLTAFPDINYSDSITSITEQHQLDLELNQALNQTDEYRNAIASENIPKILYLQAKASGSEFNTAYSNNNNIAKCEFITHNFFKVIASQELGNPRTLNISYAIANEFFKTPTHYVDNLH